MFNWTYLARLAGYCSLGLGASQCVPLFWALGNGDAGTTPLLFSVAIALSFGFAATLIFKGGGHELKHREALLFVVFVWFLAGLLGALPFWFSGRFDGFNNAMFESVSGFTTTGASVLTDIESVPDSLLFWRSFTQWLGGLGIIVLMVAILPLVGAGGMALYRAEFSGASSERLKPRIAQTAAALWRIYVGFTIAGVVALRIFGMNSLDAFCHAFTALGTGGFSTKNTSVEAFHSVSIEIILILLMVAAGMNFTQHHRLFVSRRLRTVARDTEVRFYLGALLTATVLIAVGLSLSLSMAFGQALRLASFQVVSIMTTTGFSSANFGGWTPFPQFLLLVLMWAGGSTGSTAGGIKCARIALFFKQISVHFRRVVHPRSVVSLRFSGDSLPEYTVEAALKIVYMAIIVAFIGSLLVAATGEDIVSSFSAVSATMLNVGPGLGTVGPAANYAHLSLFAKWVLIFTMIAGRLEFFGFLVIFTPFFWRK